MRSVDLSRACAFGLASLVLSLSAHADGVSVVLHGSHVERVTSGNTLIEAHDLTSGKSSGPVEFTADGGFGIGAADGRDLATYFARKNVGPEWLIDLDSWTDTNASGYDFFLFEVGGNDSVLVAPRFLDGTFGKNVTIPGWTYTGYQVPSGPNAGQKVYGLAFKSSQLRAADGSSLPLGMTLSGIRIRSASIDGCAFLAHAPNPNAHVDGDASVKVLGAKTAGQVTEFVYRGPWASETDIAPNAFLDYRLNVEVTGPQGQSLVLPGFFDADGLGGDMGIVWRARFRAPAAGLWTATARFREGQNVAVSLSPNAGAPGLLDGVTTTVQIAPFDRSAPGFLKFGTLKYTDEHYQRFTNGPYFVKVGMNSPENFLAYRGFDGVAKAPTGGGVLHDYAPHVQDYRTGDPLFTSRDHGVGSRGIMGALNYLASVGVDAIHAMPMNLGGDAQDVHPFLGLENTSFNKTHYDTSRLRQWHTVLGHAARLGIAVQFSLAETESQNEQWLDGGLLGIERKLYFRELTARLADHPALLWTLSEENDYAVDLLRDFADYLAAQDPYDHPITFHNHPNDFSDYNLVLGEKRFSATALQFDPDQADQQIETMRADSFAAGHPWLVGAVEHTPFNEGVTDQNSDEMRKRVLYDVLFSGGHLEWYAGWHSLPLGGDLTLEDFRTRHDILLDTRHAADLLRTLPFWEMQPADDLLFGESGTYGGGEVFAKPDVAYAIYFPEASSTGVLDLSASTGQFALRWFDPRKGLFTGGSSTVTAGGNLTLGPPPYSFSEDWVALLTRPETLEVDVLSISVAKGGKQQLTLHAGTNNAGRPYLMLGSMSGTDPGFDMGGLHVPLNSDRYTRWTINAANGKILRNTRGFIPASGEVRMNIVVAPGGMSSLVGTTLFHAVILNNPTDFVSNVVRLQILP